MRVSATRRWAAAAAVLAKSSTALYFVGLLASNTSSSLLRSISSLAHTKHVTIYHSVGIWKNHCTKSLTVKQITLFLLPQGMALSVFQLFLAIPCFVLELVSVNYWSIYCRSNLGVKEVSLRKLPWQLEIWQKTKPPIMYVYSNSISIHWHNWLK